MNRRDLLKWFGAGAIAAPVIGGVPDTSNSALILAPPKIEVPPANEVLLPVELFLAREVCDVVLYARQPSTGRVFRMQCDAFMTNFNIQAPLRDELRADMRFVSTGEIRVTGKIRA